MESTLGREIGPAPSDLRIFAWRLLQACLGVHLQSARSEKKNEKNNVFLWKRLVITFGSPVVGGDAFSALALVLGPEQKNWLCHPLPLLTAISMMINMWHSSCYFRRHSGGPNFLGGAIHSNQLVCMWKCREFKLYFYPSAGGSKK